MRVLMLGWELPPHNSGGLGVACEQMCQSLTNKNIDLEFLLPYHAEHKQPFRVTAALPQSVKQLQLAGIAYDSQTYTYLDKDTGDQLGDADIFTQQARYELAVEMLADQREFDVVHAHDWLTFRAALRLKMRTGKPIILHVHSIERDRAGGNSGNPFVREIEEMSLNLADRVIAVSKLTKQMIHDEYGVPLEMIEVVHNRVTPGDFPDEDPSYVYLHALKKQGYRIVTNVGRLTIQKGLTNLLRAFALVVKNDKKSVLLVVGAGEQYEELVALSAELGIGRNVIFAGFQRGAAWRDAFSVADLFVMPSVSEPFGLTPLEATGFGTPSLISKQSGVAEVMQGALKVDYWDINEMANQMIAALRSPALRSTLVDMSSREVSRMSWQHAADQIYEIYQSHMPTQAVAA